MLSVRLALLLAIVLAAPTAAAFATPKDEIAIAYDANQAPLIISAGALAAEGDYREGVLAGLLEESRIGPVPTLTLATGSSWSNVTGATLVIHSGSVFLRLENASAHGKVTTDYGFALALPRSPFSAEGAPASPALLVASPSLHAELSVAARDVAELLPMDATISVLDSSGTPLEGWSVRQVNQDLNAGRSGEAGEANVVVFRTADAFTATLTGKALAGGLGARAAAMDLRVSPGESDDFTETVETLGNVTNLMSGGGQDGPSPFDAAGPLTSLEVLSGFLNGAMIIVPSGDGGSEDPPKALEARFGSDTFDPGAFTMIRSKDLDLAWGDEEMRVGGTSDVAITQQGFHVDAPLTLGPVPILALLLWLAAAGAVVYFFVKRPPASKGKWKYRIIGGAVYAVALVAVFWWWDVSFAQTFGTSVITVLKERGLSPDSYTQVSLVLGLELVPWGIASILFALPVRIGLGVLLRYRGEGSSFKGVAKAGGLLSLAILGPIYALWIVNVLLAEVLKFAPTLFG